jgi:hypothetical protein
MKSGKASAEESPAAASYLALCPWDIERWENSGAYLGMGLAAQGAYRNLCDKAWKRQPSCVLPHDDRLLWKLANARSIEEWLALKSEVFASDAWELVPPNGWLNEVVLETFQESVRRHDAAVRAGRIAGKASGRARRAAEQARPKPSIDKDNERSLNDRRTKTNPPSPSPSPSPSKDFPAGKPPGRSPSTSNPPRAVEEAPRWETWLTPFSDAWQERFGEESKPPYGELAQFLRGLVKSHGAEEVLSRWKRFLLDSLKSQYARPARFEQGFGEWSQNSIDKTAHGAAIARPQASTRKPTAEETTAAMIMRAHKAGEGG